ncbi:MAG: glycosidase [Erysipelotrichia bacterium]|nr:glycosidase [Erysipelotrichia bacterium]
MKKQQIITKEMLQPSQDDLKIVGVFNPAVIQKDDEIIMLVRVSEAAKNNTHNVFLVPVYKNETVSFVKINKNDSNYDFSDSRVIRNHSQNYLTSISHFRVARSKDGVHFQFDGTKIFPETEYETYGIEDPRITKIDDKYYITYSAISDYGINVSLIETNDFKTFTRKGIIFPFDNKDGVIFPKQINGKYYALHRPSKSDFAKLDIWLASSPDLLHWGDHQVLTKARPTYQNSTRIGAGAVPFLIKGLGWIVIYHAANETHEYHLLAMLLDEFDPSRVLKISSKPLLIASEPFELRGFFNHVIFTCGLTYLHDEVNIYYGAADESIGLAKLTIEQILANLESVK